MEDFDTTLQGLMDAINTAIEQEVPLTKPTPFSKRWWTKELHKMRKEKQRLGRASFKQKGDPHHPAHREYKAYRNRFADHIAYAKLDCWKSWLDSADTHSIWAAHRFIKKGPSDGGSTRIPPLKAMRGNGVLIDNEEKCAEFCKTFFLPPGPDPPQIPESEYPPPAFEHTNITDLQIERAIASLRGFKASGPDGIPNEVYKHCAMTLIPYLGRLFRATFSLHYYPELWKISDTVVLRKPGKSDYSTAKAYRPIALLNCMSKILSRCVADVLVFEAETRALLPNYQFGGRAGRTTSDSIHLVTKTIKDAWRVGKVASVLFLDIKSAFPAATPEQLFHDMRMCGIPREITDWLREKLQGRYTRLRFDDFTSELIHIISSIDQGCPLSVILYGFYNSRLIASANCKNGETAVGSMDDVAVIATGHTFTETHQKLTTFFMRPKGANDWSASHNSQFSLDKFGLLNATRRITGSLGPSLQLGNTTIAPSDSHRFLGLLMDYRLRFHQHVAYALGKGMAWVATLRRLVHSHYGLAPSLVRRLYLAVAIPGMLYAVDTFITPVKTAPGQKRPRGSEGAVRKLARVHREALILITGGMRSAPTDLMTAHADMLPFRHLVDKLCQRATIRLCTLPPSHPLTSHVCRAARHYVKRHRSALHELLHTYADKNTPNHMEKILAVRHHPAWQPRVWAHVPSSKEAAEDDDAEWARHHGIMVYSDGSEQGGKVGAAAVLLRRGTRRYKILHHHLGTSEEHGIFEAEIVGSILGAELLYREKKAIQGPSVALDNTPAIQATQQLRPAPSHYLTDYFHDRIEALFQKGRVLRHEGFALRWVPGHLGIDGNEIADREAKRAAKGRSSTSKALPRLLRRPLPLSASKAKQVHIAQLQKQAADEWKSSARGIRFHSIDPTLPSPKYMKSILTLSRRQAAILFQLRSGHVPLNAHLHRIGRADTPQCPACHSDRETVTHYLLVCPAYAHARAHHFSALGRSGRNLSTLLGSSDARHPLLHYIGATQRLTRTFGNVTPKEDTNQQRGPRQPQNRRS